MEGEPCRMPDFIKIRSSAKETSHGPGLDEIAREGARRMLAQALEAEVADSSRATRSATKTAEPRSCATGRRVRGRGRLGPARLRSGHRASRTGDRTKTVAVECADQGHLQLGGEPIELI